MQNQYEADTQPQIDRSGESMSILRCLRSFRFLSFNLFVLSISAIQAEAGFLDFPQGHSADFATLPKYFVEAGVSLQDDFQMTGVRVKYKLNPKFLVFASTGISEIDTATGIPLNVGAMYGLGVFRSRVNLSFLASIGFGQYSLGQRDFDNQALTAGFHMSRLMDPTSPIVRSWYIDAALQATSRESANGNLKVTDDEVNPVLGFGIIYPFLIIDENQRGFVYGGEVFSGVEYSTNFQFSAGFRYLFK